MTNETEKTLEERTKSKYLALYDQDKIIIGYQQEIYKMLKGEQK